MKRPNPTAVLPLAGLLFLFDIAGAAERKAPTVVDPSGRVVKTFRGDGTPVDRRPDDRGAATSGPKASRGPNECAPPAAGDGQGRLRTSRGDGFTVDACGRMLREADPQAEPPEPAPPAATTPVGRPITIDRMTTKGDWYATTYTPGGTILLLGSADRYFLSDGSSWPSGAGSYYAYSTRLDRVEVSGNTIRYVLLPSPSFLYQQTDFDSGDHSSQGTLGAVGALAIEATVGSTTGVMRGSALIVSNQETYYGEARFNFFGAIVGSVVPFEQTYTLQGGATWAPDTFTRSFTYVNRGEVDFANPVSVPRAVDLKISGPPRVPEQSSVQFTATVRYENGVLRNATAEASWDVEPSALATVQGGLLATAAIPTSQETLTLRASYAERGAQLGVEKTVVCTRDQSVGGPGSWPMYQADARHTGYLPLALRPDQAVLRWQRDIGAGFALNPPAGAERKVFATRRTRFDDVPSLFALDAVTGQTLWSRNLGPVSSVNPPSYAYGAVYVQTGKDVGGSLAPLLRAHDAGTGDVIFQEPFAAQWESYYAPTIDDGKVYANGGYYGGMYRFDAFSGSSDWFLGLPQYDEWTPAVAGGLVYSYVGAYNPGLYAADRVSGALVSFIPDPKFEWNGWSMNLAPVVGGRDDVIVIHDGRLVSFDVMRRSVRWQLERSFQGQPSVARDRVYAVDAGRLMVLDEASGAELWSWQPPAGALIGPMIVTDTHLLASTATSVYALDLLTREAVWTYPVAGHLALAEGTLYVASSTGVLTAITMPDVVPSPLARLEITGPSQVVERSSASFGARAHYADGQVQDRTLVSEWSVEPATYASVGPGGVMTTTELLLPAQDVIVRARYTENGQTVEATAAVRLVIGITIPEFMRRSLEESLAIKEQLIRELDAALTRERAALSVMAQARSSSSLHPVVDPPPLALAIAQEEHARAEILASIELLRAILASGIPPAGKGPTPRIEMESGRRSH